ncbi:hypothetical protein [Tabrizicola sp.]|jgi:hypothetical protein|uniref:hypothetical protein n=1 Tax=Tabrizicola sp. TaxID=2005166 RepID=UPI0035B09B28
MAKPPPKAPALPPPTRAQCWLTFWAWALGVPLAVAAALGVIWAALWALGSMPMDPRAGIDMMTTLWWLGVIVLLYPAMLWVWWGDLRDGLKAARDWEAMTPEARAAALVEAAAAAARPKRRSRKKG